MVSIYVACPGGPVYVLTNGVSIHTAGRMYSIGESMHTAGFSMIFYLLI